MRRTPDLAAVAIVAAAALLRCWDLGRRSLWLDEAWAAVGCLDGRFTTAQVGPTPLAFAGLVRASVAVLGRSEVAVRLPAALLSVAAVALAYRVGRDLLGRPGACLAAAIVGLLPIPTYYGKELKPYSAELFLGLTTASLVAPLWRDPAWLPGWLGLVALVAVGTGLSPIAPVLAAGAFLVLLPVARRATLRYTASAGAAGVATVAWLRFAILPQVAVTPERAAYWHLFFLPRTPPAALVSASLGSALEAATWGLGTALPHHADSMLRLASLPPAATDVLGAAIVAGAVALWRRGGAWLVQLALAWHVLIAGAALAGRYPYGPARIALFFLGPTALLLAAAATMLADAVPARLRPAAWLVVLVPLLWPLAGTWDENVAHPFEREELRPVLHEVLARLRPGDALWVSPGATEAFRFYVPHPQAPVTLGSPAADAKAVGDSLAASARRGNGRVWALFAHHAAVEEPLVLGQLGSLRVVEHVVATGAAALLLAAPVSATSAPD